VTSAAWGATVGAAVGLAYVHHDAPVTQDWLDQGSFEVDVAGERFAARATLKAPLR
jgi:4-methylaminobutanoate oxidase (formaldehyde-forming)